MKQLVLVLLILLPSASALSVSEILFNPHGNDNGKEFIELVGTENLTSCTITDSKSSDELELLRIATNNIILIVENDGTFQETITTATIYGAGKAIGNGLGNTEDLIVITCNETLLNVSYNVEEIPEYEDGFSIIFDGTWITGIENGTPGSLEPEIAEEVVESVEEIVEESGSRFCNTTLAITVSATEGEAGDVVLFTIISDGFASFEASADEVFLEGDTITRRAYSMTLPNAMRVKLAAFASQCDAKQRAVRYIDIVQKNQTIPPNITVNITEDEPLIINASNTSTLHQSEPEPPEEMPKPIITGAVVYDADRNVVPWVSAFGIVTLLVSTGLFFRMSRSEK